MSLPLKKTQYIWMNGKFIHWDDAKIHVLTHGLHYGSGIFEGIRCYPLDNGELSIFKLKEHINTNTTELMIKLMIMAAIYEFMFMHKTPTKVVINEYLKVADFFVSESQKSFLNAILDKVSNISRHKDV